jgi:hypothetical protein
MLLNVVLSHIAVPVPTGHPRLMSTSKKPECRIEAVHPA